MRVSNHAARHRRVVTLVLAFTLTACSAAVPASAPPATSAPTPVITPDPHLTEPATADAVFNAVRGVGLPLSITNAVGGDPNSPVVKRINAAVDNWPLIITQYKTSAMLRSALKWDPSAAPASGSPPYAFVGLNILISFGPSTATGRPAAPDAARQAEALRLVGVIDPLLWPLEQRSVTPVPTRTPAATTAPTQSPKPSAQPKASAKPKASVKP